MKHTSTKNIIILFASACLMACGKGDNQNPTPEPNDPKEVILTKVGSDLDRFSLDGNANTLEIYSSSVANGISQTYSRDTTLAGPKVKMDFSNTEFAKIDKNTGSGSFFGQLKNWEQTSVNISSPTNGQIVAQEIGTNTKALNVSYTKVYQPVYFTGFSTQEKAVQTWKDMTAYKGKWTLVKDQKFKINNKDWQIK
jgi:hypothetical protein